MWPHSVAENPGFKHSIRELEPCCEMPSRSHLILLGSPICLAKYHRNIMPPSLASFPLPKPMLCFLWGRQEWEPVHHYPCSNCLILWPFKTIRASKDSLLVSSSPDIMVFTSEKTFLASGIKHNSFYAHISLTTLDPKQAILDRRGFLKGRGYKLCWFSSLDRLCEIMILAGEKERPPKGGIYHASNRDNAQRIHLMLL